MRILQAPVLTFQVVGEQHTLVHVRSDDRREQKELVNEGAERVVLEQRVCDYVHDTWC